MFPFRRKAVLCLSDASMDSETDGWKDRPFFLSRIESRFPIRVTYRGAPSTAS